jgi:hypothetical protein
MIKVRARTCDGQGYRPMLVHAKHQPERESRYQTRRCFTQHVAFDGDYWLPKLIRLSTIDVAVFVTDGIANQDLLSYDNIHNQNHFIQTLGSTKQDLSMTILKSPDLISVIYLKLTFPIMYVIYTLQLALTRHFPYYAANSTSASLHKGIPQKHCLRVGRSGDRIPGAHPAPYTESRVFPGGKVRGAWLWPPTLI